MQLSPEDNRLLSALPSPAKQRLFPKLELVDLKLGSVIYESHLDIGHVYFPVDCLLSTLYEMEDGETAEVSIIGNDGFAGIVLLLGGDTSPNRTLVQSAGHAYRLARRPARAEFDRHAEMHDMVLRYVQVLLMQTSQTAACNRHHSVEQQLCRWLLLSIDRLRGNTLCMTQQLIANMLGVRREGVTHAAGKLQKLGLISYERGIIKVKDRWGIEDRCCECYAVVKRESDRLLTTPASVSRSG